MKMETNPGKIFTSPVFTGILVGILAPVLVLLGNPSNMGVCVACFQRDMAGALGLHRAGVVQYFRPEIVGFVLGSSLAAFLWKEWKPRAGSSPVTRFTLGIFAMVGALVFLGCPWRALLRLSGGDLNAVTGLLGLSAGIAVGNFFLKRGFSLGRAEPARAMSGLVLPVMLALALLLFAVLKPVEGRAFFSSISGPGAMHAPLLVSLVVGVVIGFLAQRSRFCTVGAVRDRLLIRDSHLLRGVVALVATALVMNLLLSWITGGNYFHVSFGNQPISHSAHLWNFLGMLLAGLAFVLAGGCPGRQLFLAGEGDGDSAVFVLGMIAGGALAHDFGLAAVPDKMIDGSAVIGGPGAAGMVAVGLGLLYCLWVGFGNTLNVGRGE